MAARSRRWSSPTTASGRNPEQIVDNSGTLVGMATMNPILRFRRAFRTAADREPLAEEAAEEVAEEAADAISEYGYSRRESDLRFERMMAEMRQQTAEMRESMAEMRTQMMLAILVATGLIIGVIAAAVAILAAID